MIPLIIPVSQTPEASRLRVSVHIWAKVLSAQVVRQQANVWLLEMVMLTVE
jgi:hypothetical protein